MKFLSNILTFSLSLFLTLCFFNSSLFAQNESTQIAKNQNVSEEKTSDAEITAPKEELVDEFAIIKTNNNLNRVGVNQTQNRALTLDQAIRLALSNNNDIEIARDDVRIAELSLRSLEGTYDGVFTISPNFDRNSTNGQNPTKDLRVNSDFTQLIEKGGGSYRFFFNNSRTENAFAQAQATQGNIGTSGTSGLYFTSVGVTYTQPLWRDFRIDQTRRQIKIQRKRIAQTDADFRRRTIEIVSQVQRAYWDLVFALRDQQNRVANLNLTKENLRQVEARIEAGSAAPLQRAEVSTELANRESDVLVASQQVSIAENTLKQLILKDASAPEWTESFTPTDSPVFSLEKIELQNAITDAIQNRPELSRLRLESEVNNIDIDYFKNQTKPQIDLTSTFSLDGLASTTGNTTDLTVPLISGNPTTNADAFLLQQIQRFHVTDPIPNVTIPATQSFLVGGYTQAFRNIFRSDAPNYSVGVTISFPLRNQQAKANLASARVQEERIEAQKRQQEQAIMTEVRNAVQAVETAQQRVLTARRARENAEIQLAGERKLYEVGRSTTFILFQRENALTNARNAEIRAETDYNKALADLQRATSTTLRMNNVVVDSPTENDEDGN